MIYLILTLVVLLVLLGYKYKKKIEKQNETKRKEREELLRREEEQRDHARQVERALELQSIEEALEGYKTLNIERIDAVLDQYFDEAYEIKGEFFEQSLKDSEKEWENGRVKLEQLEIQVTDFKSYVDSINQAILREKKIKEQETFYIIALEEDEREDIKYLQEVALKIKKPEIINKLIFETYYRRPMKELFNRVAEGKKPCGIYKITSLITKEVYIGKSVEIIPRRWTEHVKTALDIGSIASSPLHTAMKRDGIENFTFEILEECERDKLTTKEKEWITAYESDIYGLNAKRG